MKFSEEKKNEYWNHFLSQKQFWGFKFTLKKLEKIKSILWDDAYFWEDILFRHNGYTETPEQMKERSKSTYDHCIGNMAGMISEALYKNKLTKW